MKEEKIDSDDEFQMTTSVEPVVTRNADKLEKDEEEGSEEDEDDWEEVEGKWWVENSVSLLCVCKNHIIILSIMCVYVD